MSIDCKSQLKEARNAIKNKEFNVAIKICKEVLKIDDKNYMALVLMGAAYQDGDKEQAAECLMRAVNCSKDPTVALQGLLNCAQATELPDICRKLLKLTPDRFDDLHKKLYSTVQQNPELVETGIEIFNEDLQAKEVNPLKINSAYDYLAQIYLRSSNDLNDKWLELVFEKALEYKLEQPDSTSEYSKLYLKLLYKLKKFEKMVEKGMKIVEKQPEDLNALEWLCKVYSENYESAWVDTFNFHNPIENLLKIQATSLLGLISKGIWLYKQKDYGKSKEFLENVNSRQPNWSICHKLLIEVSFKVGAFVQTELLVRELKTRTVNDDMLLCKSLVEQNDKSKLSEAIQLCRDLVPTTTGNEQTDMIFYLAKALIFNEQPGPADKTLEKLKALGKLDYNTLGLAIKSRIAGAYDESIKILEANPIDSSTEYFLELGKSSIHHGDFNKTLTALLKGTKLEPYNSECFFRLGELYERIGDIERAQKCYEKSLTLNINNKMCVVNLSKIYRKKNEFKANHLLLENLTNVVIGKEKVWSIRQLGLNYLSLQNYNEAINQFRLALRYDVGDIPSWEGLADSYLARGSFNSAMKVYQKVIELDGGSLYPKLQVANINSTLMMHTEAIEHYEAILIIDPNYFPALKGMAETHLGYAKKLFVQQIFGRSRDEAQKSLDYILRAIKLKSYMSCVWRHLATTLDFIAANPLKYAFAQVPGTLVGVEETETIIDGDKLFDLASKCYCRAIKIEPNDSLLWYDLALNYYSRAIRSTADDKIKYLKLSLETIKYAIKMNSMRWMFWNLMGCIVATKEIANLPLAQHCFIKAVTVDKKSYTSWTNLGVMYLLQKEIKLSNKAFSMAQQSEPNYVNAWTGQATVAELICEEEEALDLFRHCTQLGFHPEAAIGYAHWVCTTLNNKEKMAKSHYQYAIESMHAVPMALDSIDWYCRYDDINSNVQSLCYLGYLNYQMQLWIPAIKAFKMAVEKAEGGIKDNLLCNLGYSQLKVNRPKEAIKAFSAVTDASYQSQVGLALSYFKAKQYEDSYSLYESALQWLATSNEEKSMILIAMSSMVYDFQGDKDAKTVLFECINLTSPPIEGLYSACALGILHQDTQLSELVLQELKKNEHNQKYCHHIAFLKSQIILINENKKSALLYLISQIHLMPNNPQLRKVFVKFLLKNYSEDEKYAKSISRIAQSSIILNRKNMKKNTSTDAAKSLAMASDAMKSVDKKEQKILAQKAIHVNPACKEAWSALIRCR